MNTCVALDAGGPPNTGGVGGAGEGVAGDGVRGPEPGAPNIWVNSPGAFSGFDGVGGWLGSANGEGAGVADGEGSPLDGPPALNMRVNSPAC